MEASGSTWFLIVVVLVIIWLVDRSGWFRIFIGKPNLKLTELDELLHDEGKVAFSGMHQHNGNRTYHFWDTYGSVKYTVRDDGLAPTVWLDVNVPGKAGFILMIVGQQVVEMERIGGHIQEDPDLLYEQELAVFELLQRVEYHIAMLQTPTKTHIPTH